MLDEMVSRGCVLTLENGAKVQATMYYKKKQIPSYNERVGAGFCKEIQSNAT